METGPPTITHHSTLSAPHHPTLTTPATLLHTNLISGDSISIIVYGPPVLHLHINSL